ncbi:hypothetical protein N7541_005413 [Penicillium brevicompactum]|uniref:Uncharacterized protein n=1 Tax=Penicillium brevicompactum TaxID=5074 RepID=A0A9W9UWX2_PENBR|nr:hypothetical protein N7541_005413 [Penicillium brevicompactum]
MIKSTRAFSHAACRLVPPIPTMESPDHILLGDAVELKLESGSRPAKDVRFKLESELNLTYGEISALAGDFYGTWSPISDPPNEDERTRRFISAWDSLAKKSTLQPKEGEKIMKIIKDQHHAVGKAIKEAKPISDVYADAKWNLNFLAATQDRAKLGQATYYDLAMLDWDHFGSDAEIAYKTGHFAAMEVATSKKEPATLYAAYAMNAFADHFLQDSFSAGHVRTPRRALHLVDGKHLLDEGANMMHNEDGIKGLWVSNSGVGKSGWMMYGDREFSTEKNKVNRDYCQKAIQASADEIYTAWSDQRLQHSCNALQYLPSKESAFDSRNHKPLWSLVKRAT